MNTPKVMLKIDIQNCFSQKRVYKMVYLELIDYQGTANSIELSQNIVRNWLFYGQSRPMTFFC